MLHNSFLYKAEDNIICMHEDALKTNGILSDVVFSSPAWGGIQYQYSEYKLIEYNNKSSKAQYFITYRENVGYQQQNSTFVTKKYINQRIN